MNIWVKCGNVHFLHLFCQTNGIPTFCLTLLHNNSDLLLRLCWNDEKERIERKNERDRESENSKADCAVPSCFKWSGCFITALCSKVMSSRCNGSVITVTVRIIQHTTLRRDGLLALDTYHANNDLSTFFSTFSHFLDV